MSERADRRYPFFGKPPAKEPRPASEEPALLGKRVILSMPDGFVYDMRAASKIYSDRDGRKVIDIVSEEHFYRWMITRQSPVRKPFPTSLVWVE